MIHKESNRAPFSEYSRQGSANLFCERTDSEHLGLWESHIVFFTCFIFLFFKNLLKM